MLSDFIQADAGYRYIRVDVFLSCRELEFDGGRRDNLGNDERTCPLVIQFLHGAVRGVVLEIQPSFVLQCCLMVPVIVLLHVVCCLFQGSLHLHS